MPRPGAKPLADRPVAWKIHIRGSIAAQIELLFTDPVTGRVKKGERSKLINQLLAQWLEEREKKIDNSTGAG